MSIIYWLTVSCCRLSEQGCIGEW